MLVIFTMVLGGTGVPAWAAAQSQDYTQLSLEDLMDIEITSVAKKPQLLSEAAAAVFVLTHDEIRRSGVTSIPEALRMVPGLEVARIDANKWAVTARGFNGRFAAKLLVLIDGRSVYTPLFSGVFWETIDTPLEDIDRIEVIRGPGASLWGANAVNGVINIITKSADDTQGGLLAVGGGTEERTFGTLRYGGTFGAETPYRVYLKYNDRDSGEAVTGGPGDDDWEFMRGGFRIDHQPSDGNAFMLQGEIYEGSTGETLTEPLFGPPYQSVSTQENDYGGFNVLGRWSKIIGDGSDFSFQAYFDRSEYQIAAAEATVDTVDLDFQHSWSWGAAQEIIWGLGYRRINMDMSSHKPYFRTDNPEEEVNIVNAFIQDDITLIPDTLRLTLGTKVEYNEYTYWQLQPTARLLWKPAAKQSVWASVSRGVRTPSWGERDFDIAGQVIPPGTLSPDAPKAEVWVIGNRDQDSENLMAYELGYRIQLRDNLAFDTAAYFNDYDNLRDTVAGQPYGEGTPSEPVAVLPYHVTNTADSEIYGFELSVDWRPWSWGRIQGAYTLIEEDETGGEATAVGQSTSPQHQFSLRAGANLPGDLELDLWWRYVDNLGGDINSYQNLDLRLGWRLSDHMELSLVGQTLLGKEDVEFVPEFIDTAPTEMESGVYAKLTWEF